MNREEVNKQIKEKLTQASDEYHEVLEKEEEKRSRIKGMKELLLQEEKEKQESIRQKLHQKEQDNRNKLEQWQHEFKKATEAGDALRIQELLKTIK
ncbi:hypothetical protein J7I93_13710 [Bacillus sp. ISL-47]|uniref:hypothetical protein n=1 Tax=Bacillus sp. ISL-47 TaxID=2819130 RepID=UPI001BEB71CB|nr:hypothetical protein [Bacillus sp. ISL-47]MBT2689243.1 hypothetical protein [Bacillus sp. ISL-47]MBT2708632.1 hypothetical protein [Pseudomonas sp. ISL-84]